MPIFIGQVVGVSFSVGRLLGSAREEGKHPFESIKVLNLTADQRGKQDPGYRKQLKDFFNGLPGNMKGSTTLAREARNGLVIDKAYTTLRVRPAEGNERTLHFPDRFAFTERYQPLLESLLIVGTKVFAMSECPKCDDLTLGTGKPRELEHYDCEVCNAVDGSGDGHVRYSVQRRREEPLPQSYSGTSRYSTHEQCEQREVADSLVPSAWRRVPAFVLEQALVDALGRLRLHCPYEAHDVSRVLDWCRHDPLHRFDEEALRELVSALLTEDRSWVQKLFLLAS